MLNSPIAKAAKPEQAAGMRRGHSSRCRSTLSPRLERINLVRGAWVVKRWTASA